MTGRNPWAVLGVPEDATYLEIQRAYRRLVKQTHPDSGGDAGEFAAVAHAVEAVRRVVPPPPRQLPARPTPYDSWINPSRATRSWTEGGFRAPPGSSPSGGSWATFTVASVGADFPTVLSAEISRVRAAVGH